MSDNSESAAIAAGFLRYLDANNKRELLPEVVALLQKELGPMLPELTVESATALSEADKSELIALLAGKPHLGDINFVVNPELIGGIRVIHGDSVLDTSVQGRLKKVYA